VALGACFAALINCEPALMGSQFLIKNCGQNQPILSLCGSKVPILKETCDDKYHREQKNKEKQPMGELPVMKAHHSPCSVLCSRKRFHRF
jgi:hypothetical protein